MSSCYSCKFNKATVKKLGKSFDVNGIVYLEDEVAKKWDECLNGELGLPFLVCVDTTKLLNKCLCHEVREFLEGVSCVNFEFDPKEDMEQVYLKDKAPIGVWIKASDVTKYDFSCIDNADVLLRIPCGDYGYGCEEKRLNVTMNYKNYTVGFLCRNHVYISANEEENIPLDSCDYDIMVIKLDTNK